MKPKHLSKLAMFATVGMLYCSATLTTTDIARAQCNPCDFTISTITDWGGCACPLGPCGEDPIQTCSIPTNYVINCGPNMCNYVDSIVITPPSGVCYSLCGATNTPTHQSWATDHAGCDQGIGKMFPWTALPMGANGSMVFKLCCSSTGNTFQLTIYSGGSPVGCTQSFNN